MFVSFGFLGVLREHCSSSFHSGFVQSLICSSLFPLQLKFGNRVFQHNSVLLNLGLHILWGHPEHCREHRKFLEVPASWEDAGNYLIFCTAFQVLAKLFYVW